ncbi:FolC bifunctional protein [Basidiobolus meristosporus CBS 931.73]|uniref:Dihydrofolate synthetase n=1 Tax=Basidiobolus meristosporus CBS 931.73 TaxID=1314790 RepID=A0A1Y1YLN1_9FUNG|nr:FolC bifunctional protein [Basidiobolus meristosporus CBS 931.73]|eukprot:ORX98921.1 FolC bifunctional protein [Basidiobolus meristosporus CBS 931.73]
MELGLERIEALLVHLGSPQNSLPVIHVAGTNGKGSVTAYLEGVLLKAGYTTGRFNSPHLLEPRDSIRVNGKPITKAEYESTLETIQALEKKAQLGVTQFEMLTAAMFYLFKKHTVDYAIIEVGCGGLLDATNVVTNTKVAVITQIGLDHIGILGNTLEEIAFQKSGILKPNCPAVVCEQTEPVVMPVLEKRAREMASEVILARPARRVNPNLGEVEYITAEGQESRLQYPIPLLGDIQLENSAVAVHTLLLLRSLGAHITDDDIISGMKHVSWAARLEWVETKTKAGRILLDGAHNPPAAKALREYVEGYLVANNLPSTTPVQWIFGATRGKNVNEIFSYLLKPGDSVYCVPFSQPENMPWISCIPPKEIEDSLRDSSVHTKAFNGVVAALDDVDPQKFPLVVMCGSLYLAADFIRARDLD